MMSESRSGAKYSDVCSCNAYLQRVVQKRSSELKAAYKHIVELDHQGRSTKPSVFVQTQLETDDVAVQTVYSLFSCDKCSALKETVQKVQQQLNDSSHFIASKDKTLAELNKQLTDSVSVISELRTRADAEEAARRVKEEQVEELEELVEVCKSESLATQQQQHSLMENGARENASLKLELNAIKASLQAKDEALAQNMLEKDDLEDVNARLQTTNKSLLHQLDELKSQLKNQNSHFEGEIQKLADEKQQLIDKVQNLNSECLQAACVPFSCSQPVEFLASQQSNELSAVKMELLTVQAEKEDLIQQLHQCKTELSSRQLQSDQWIQQNNVSSAPVSTKPPSTASSRAELESQNAALLGQLLVLEDQLSESDVQLQDSRHSQWQTAEQLDSALKKLADVSSCIASLERENLKLETDLSATKMNLETSKAKLQECETHLSLLEGKLSSAGNRQRQLMSQKQLLESQNRELSQKLQLASSSSTQHLSSLPSCSTSAASHKHVEVMENQTSFADKLSATAETFQQTGSRQTTRGAVTANGGTSKCQRKLETVAESRDSCNTAASTSVDRRLVPYTTSPAELLDVCKTPKSVYSEASSSRNSTDCLKRHVVECASELGSGGKRHLFSFNDIQIGEWWCIVLI